MTFAEVQRYPRDWGVMDETPRWYNPATGRMEPIPSFNHYDPLPDFRAPDLETDKIVPGGPYTGEPWEGFEPIGPYRPEIDKSEVVPLDNVFSSLFDIARANSANPHSTFIRDPGGSNKLIKFHYPLDLRTIEEKMGGYPFNQARNQGPSTPVGIYDGKVLPNYGGTRNGPIRIKGHTPIPLA